LGVLDEIVSLEEAMMLDETTSIEAAAR
jgi:hypothetical protein